MPQHFLLSAAARTLSLASVARMSDEEAEKVFVRLRWQDNRGDAYCPHCGCLTVYSCRRPNGAPRWRCKACRKDFSVTSGTLFAFHKMPLRSYLMAIAIFANEVKGKFRFAQESAWREDHRKEPNGSQVDRLVALAMHNKPSVDFCGYWQRSNA